MGRPGYRRQYFEEACAARAFDGLYIGNLSELLSTMYPEEIGTEEDKLRRACAVLKKYQYDIKRKATSSPVLRLLKNPRFGRNRPWILFAGAGSTHIDSLRTIRRIFANEYVFELYVLALCTDICESTVPESFRSRVHDRTQILLHELSPFDANPDILRNVSESQLQKLVSPLRGRQPIRIYDDLKAWLEYCRSTTDIAQIDAKPHEVRTEPHPESALLEVEDGAGSADSNWQLLYTRRVTELPIHDDMQLETRLLEQNLSQHAEYSKSSKTTVLNVMDAIYRFSHVVLTGPSGSGKSLRMIRTAKEWIEGANAPANVVRFAVVVRLQDFNLHSDIGELIANAVCEYIGKGYQDLVIKWLNSTHGTSSDVLLVLDGYNELLPSNRQKFNRLFQQFMGSRQNRVLISTRTFDSEIVRPDWRRMILQQPSGGQIRAFLRSKLGEPGEQLYEARIKGSTALTSLSATPFFLNALATYVESRGLTDIPSSRANLIAALVDDSISRKLDQEAVQVGTSVSLSELRAFLSAVAHGSLALDHRPFVHPKDTKPLWADSNIRVQEILEFAELVGILASSGTGRNDERVSFSHDLVRDYFAASFMYEQIRDDETQSLPDVVHVVLEDSKWDESLLMLADYFKREDRCNGLIRVLLDHDISLAADFVSRLSEVSPELLITVARLTEGNEQTPAFHRQHRTAGHEPAAKLFAKLPDAILPHLYHTLPIMSDAWCSIVLAFAIKSGDFWKRLLPLREDTSVSARSMILLAVSRVRTSDALMQVISLIRTQLSMVNTEIEIGYKLACTSAFGNNSFGLASDQLLDMLMDSELSDLTEVVSSLMKNVDFETSDIDRLKTLARHENSIVSRDAIDALSRIQLNLVLPFIEPDFLREQNFIDPWLVELLRALARAGSASTVFETVQELLRTEELSPRKTLEKSSLLLILGEIGTAEAGEMLMEALLESDEYVPPESLVPFAHCNDIIARLSKVRDSGSRHIHARATIALAAMGHLNSVTDLLTFIESGSQVSVQDEVDRKFARIFGNATLSDDDVIGTDTARMALDAAALSGDTELAQQIWQMARSGRLKGELLERSMHVLTDLRYRPIFPILCQWTSENHYHNVRVYGMAAELIEDARQEECRDILLDLKSKIDEGNSEDSVHITYIAQAVLRRRGWRFAADLNGWPLGKDSFVVGSVPSGYKELQDVLLPSQDN